jgi:hypothetical protein
MKRITLAAFVFDCISATAQAQTVTPTEARAIAKEVYIYGFPIVDSYRILYSYFVDRSSAEYKAGWNERVANNARVFTPDDNVLGGSDQRPRITTHLDPQARRQICSARQHPKIRQRSDRLRA